MSHLNFLSVSWLSMCWSRHHRLLLSNCFPQTWTQSNEHVWWKILLATFLMVFCDWTPHKWGKVCSFPSSREPRHLTDAVSSYIQTWTSDHSDWKEMMFLIRFKCEINQIKTCIYRVFQTNAVVPHASSSEWVGVWLEICSEVNCPHLDLLAETFPTVTTAELVIVARCLLVLKQSLKRAVCLCFCLHLCLVTCDVLFLPLPVCSWIPLCRPCIWFCVWFPSGILLAVFSHPVDTYN